MEELWLAKSEAERVAVPYLEMLKQICSQEDLSYEADSEADFRDGKIIKVDRAPFPTWKENEVQTEGLDDAYFTDLAEGVERAREEASPTSVEREKLEKWFTVKSCKLNDSDQYVIAPCHPMVRMIDWRKQEICERFRHLTAGREALTHRIMWAVLKDYLKLNENFYVYGTGQVYYSMWKDGCRRAVPWREVGTLTPISSVRLIEKVSSWVRRNHGNPDGKKEKKPKVRIAYVGTIEDKEAISEYFRDNPIQLDSEKITPQVEFIQLQRVLRGEQYTFERMDGEEGVKRFYNFSSLTDARELFKNFEIVLFLDESYFYKQGQTPKDLKEKGAASYVSWCLKEMKRELEANAKDGASEQDDTAERRLKSNFYSQIYDRAGLWLNGYGKRETSKFGFDQELFQTIAQTVCPEHDVYLYIGRGEAIGDINLPTQSLCNDERYDGKKLLVYKVNGQAEAADEIDVREPMVQMLQSNGSPMIASLDLWKLVKSIGSIKINQREGACETEDFKLNVSEIALLRKSFLNVSISKKDGKPTLQFKLYSPEAAEQQKERLMDFARGFLELCKDGRGFPYVRNFLYELLISALVARADSAEGLFYAYLMKAGDFVEIDANVTGGSMTPKKHNSLFCVRRSIYSAIQGLDNIMVRDMEKRLDILKYEFRYKYCPDINEKEFILLLEKVHQFCLDAGYTESTLCLLTEQEENGKA